MKTKWLNNQLGFIGCYTLVFDEAQYKQIYRELHIEYPTPYNDSTTTANAWVKTYVNPDTGHNVYLVCIDETKLMQKTVPEIVGCLAHEATHIWQHSAEWLGERNASIEFEAYCIGHITAELCRALFGRKFPQLLRPRRVKP